MRPLALLACLVLGCSPEAPPDLVVFAAASASDAARDVAGAMESSDGLCITVSPGATSTLARQIDAGAPADVFVAVGSDWPAWLDNRQRLDRSNTISVAFGRLVVVVPESAEEWNSVEPLAVQERVALADPSHVPAGQFAKDGLSRMGLWRDVESRVVPFPDVRAVLGAVASGLADAGVVYATDARLTDRVRIAAAFPDSLDLGIHYLCAPLADSPRVARARDYCQRARAEAGLWRVRGFDAPDEMTNHGR